MNNDLYIVDFERFGNVVKLYLGNETQVKNAWGDDWDDAPYQDNAGKVYDEFLSGTMEFAFPSKYVVREPANNVWDRDYGYTKDDMKKRIIPAVVIFKLPDGTYAWEFDTFDRVVGASDAIKIYFGDNISEVRDKIVNYGGMILE